MAPTFKVENDDINISSTFERNLFYLLSTFLSFELNLSGSPEKNYHKSSLSLSLFAIKINLRHHSRL